MANEPSQSEFDKKIEEKSAETAFQLVWGWVGKLRNKAWDQVAIRDATKAYAENYRERHGAIHVLGMSKPVPLHDIYTAVRIVPRDFLGAFVNPDQMEQSFKESGRQHQSFQKDKVEDGIKVANRDQFLNLLGAPGAGKSTFLRRLGQEAMLARKAAESIDPKDLKLNSSYEHSLLPVYLELRLFKTKSIDIVARIAEEFSNSHFPEDRKFAEAALKAGKLLVLLDGLDEVPTDKLTETIDHIRDFVDKHARAGNRFVTSCRTAHYKSAFPRFSDMVVADFSDEQIEQFAKNWFAGLHHQQGETANAFVTVLKDSANAAALELARTPLLLTCLCLTYANGQELPPTRATLYRRALDLLLREWAASKRVHDEPVYRELNADLELDMLAEFAEELFREDRFFFDRKRITDHIRTFMELQLNAPKSLDAGKILEAIEVQQGLIVRRAEDTYSFSHLTIQEYLTAKKLRDGSEADWGPVVKEHAITGRWAVVFESMAGMGKADGLLRAIAARSITELAAFAQADGSIRLMLTWVSSEPSSRTSPEQAAGRLIAHVHARYLHLDLDRHLDRHLAHDRAHVLAFRLADDLDLELRRYVPFLRAVSLFNDRSIALETIRDHLLAALHGFLETHHPSEIHRPRISKKFFTAANSSGATHLENHLQLCGLLVRCKKAAYRVTNSVWDEVCDTILQLPTGS